MSKMLLSKEFNLRNDQSFDVMHFIPVTSTKILSWNKNLRLVILIVGPDSESRFFYFARLRYPIQKYVTVRCFEEGLWLHYYAISILIFKCLQSHNKSLNEKCLFALIISNLFAGTFYKYLFQHVGSYAHCFIRHTCPP